MYDKLTSLSYLPPTNAIGIEIAIDVAFPNTFMMKNHLVGGIIQETVNYCECSNNHSCGC